MIDGAGGIGLALESDGRRRRGLFLRQAIDEVVHDEIGHVDVLARAVIEMVATDGKTVAVAAEQEHVQIGPGETNAGRKWDGAAVNVMRAVAVDEIWKTRRTTDSGEGDDLFVLEIAFLEDLVKRSEHGEIAATGTPRRVIGRDRFLR